MSDTPRLFAMIHARALPGAPRHDAPLSTVIAQAVEEAGLLADAGVDGLILENMHDAPYLNGSVGPEIVAAMTAVGVEVRRSAPKVSLGVQVLAGANREALAVALAIGADFIRAENFVFAHVADEGLMPTADAGPLLRYRRQIDATHIRIVADIRKKHAAHALTADVPLIEVAQAAEFFGADGVIITGVATGRPASPQDVRDVREAVGLPVWVGSGVTPGNFADFAPHADAVIVGSALKRDGLWSNPLAPDAVKDMVEAVRDWRSRLQ